MEAAEVDQVEAKNYLLLFLQAVDVLTPVGRGQALLVVGLPGSGKSSLVLNAILGQKQQAVQCIYACVDQR